MHVVVVTVVVAVRVLVLDLHVLVQVLVMLGEVKPHAESHQCCRGPERRARALIEQPQGERRAVERRHRKIRAGARGAEIA